MSSTAKRKLDDVEENVEGEVDEKKKKRKIQRCDTKEVNATAESISTILKTKSPEKSDSTKTTTTTTTITTKNATTDEKKEEPVIESGFLAFADTNPWATTSATNEDSKETTSSWDTTTNADSKETNDTSKSEGDSNNTSWQFTMDDFGTNDNTSWDFSGYDPAKEKKDEKDTT